MADKMELELAKNVYDTLCGMLDTFGWKYKKDEENLVAHFGVNGDDVLMQFIICIDAERQIIRLLSPLPFNMSKDKRLEGAVATCSASYIFSDGSFDYDISDGSICFRMTASFRKSLIGEGLFKYMIACAVRAVEDFNDKFLALDKGLISIDDFIKNKS